MVPETQFNECTRELARVEAQLLTDPTAASVAETIARYAQLVRQLCVCVAQLHRGVRVTWGSTRDFHVNVTCARQQIAKDGDHVLARHVAALARHADFIRVYEGRYKQAQLEAHRAFRAGLKELQRERFEAYVAAAPAAAAAAAANGFTARAPAPQPASTRDKLLATNRKITSNLVRSNHVLQSSVLQSELNLSELQVQTDSLHRLNERFDALSGVLDTSSKMIRVIQHASSREKRNIYVSLGFLAACVAWVLWRRVFKAPVKLALWLWFRFFRAVLVALGAVPGVTTAAVDTVGTTLARVVAPTVSTPTVSLASAASLAPADRAVENAVDGVFSRLLDEL